MNRRSFLHIFGAGLPAVVVAEKFGLIERVRSYFFAPKGGWNPNENWATLTRTWWEKDGIWQADIVGTHVLQIRRLEGLPYWSENCTGTFMGISRKPYEGIYPKVDFDKALLIG